MNAGVQSTVRVYNGKRKATAWCLPVCMSVSLSNLFSSVNAVMINYNSAVRGQRTFLLFYPRTARPTLLLADHTSACVSATAFPPVRVVLWRRSN